MWSNDTDVGRISGRLERSPTARVVLADAPAPSLAWTAPSTVSRGDRGSRPIGAGQAIETPVRWDAPRTKVNLRVSAFIDDAKRSAAFAPSSGAFIVAPGGAWLDARRRLDR